MMSQIRGKNTKHEILLRTALHARGFRYILHDPRLPGKPDIVLPKHRAIILFNGCFWHGHDCHLFRWPATRPDFWKAKITRNREKDSENTAALRSAGWRILTVWECSLRGKSKLPLENVIDDMADWLNSGSHEMEISGRRD